MIHSLKTEQRYFRAVEDGEKRFEIRKDDRGYCVGDFLALNEISRQGVYTGRSMLVKVTYLLRDPQFCKEGFVVMAVQPCKVILPNKVQEVLVLHSIGGEKNERTS